MEIRGWASKQRKWLRGSEEKIQSIYPQKEAAEISKMLLFIELTVKEAWEIHFRERDGEDIMLKFLETSS